MRQGGGRENPCLLGKVYRKYAPQRRGKVRRPGKINRLHSPHNRSQRHSCDPIRARLESYRFPKNFLSASAAASFELFVFEPFASGGRLPGWARAAINASMPDEAAADDTEEESPAAMTVSAPTGTELTDEASLSWSAL